MQHIPVQIRKSADGFYRIARNHYWPETFVSTSNTTGWTNSCKSASIWRDSDEAKQYAFKQGLYVLPTPVLLSGVPQVVTNDYECPVCGEWITLPRQEQDLFCQNCATALHLSIDGEFDGRWIDRSHLVAIRNIATPTL